MQYKHRYTKSALYATPAGCCGGVGIAGPAASTTTQTSNKHKGTCHIQVALCHTYSCSLQSCLVLFPARFYKVGVPFDYNVSFWGAVPSTIAIVACVAGVCLFLG